MKIIPDLWQSKYTGAAEIDVTADLNENFEVTLDRGPFSAVPVDVRVAQDVGLVGFVDGVERVDMHAFVEHDGAPYNGMFGSTAVGVVCLSGAKPHSLNEALRLEPQVARYFISNCKDMTSYDTINIEPTNTHELGTIVYKPVLTKAVDSAGMRAALISRMSDLEHRVAKTLYDEVPGVKWILSDGFLDIQQETETERKWPRPIIGIIKSIQKIYLPSECYPVLDSLQKGQRTTIFSIETVNKKDKTELKKWSYYIRLAESRTHSMMANLARIEMPDVLPADAREWADVTSALIMHYSSNLYADTRAPQNLYPIGALEDVLKNRLGNADIIRNRILSHYGART